MKKTLIAVSVISALFMILTFICGFEYMNLDEKYETVSSSNASLEKELKDVTEKYNTLLKESQELYYKYSPDELEGRLDSLREEIAKLETSISEKQTLLETLEKTIEPLQAEKQRKLEEGITVYEDDKVKINYYKIGKSSIIGKDDSVIFKVENKTDVVITIQCDTLSLDGEMIDSNKMCSEDISPQSKGNAYVTYFTEITNKDPSYISGQLRVIDFSDELFNSYDVTFVNVGVK